jgi:hypothetical protein
MKILHRIKLATACYLVISQTETFKIRTKTIYLFTETKKKYVKTKKEAAIFATSFLKFKNNYYFLMTIFAVCISVPFWILI